MHPSEVEEQPVSGQQKSGRARGVLWTSLFILLALAAGVGWLASYALSPGPQTEPSEAAVFIPRGTSVDNISALLAEADLVDDDIRFGLLTKLLGVSAKLPAGEFLLHTNQTPLQLIDELVDAKPVQHRITIAEGLTAEEIAEIFAGDAWVDKTRFLSLLSDGDFIGDLGLGPVSSLEGYLFPDTYMLIRPSPGEAVIIRRLVKRALEVWNSLDQGETHLDRHQAFTLASIVEKETGQGEERPLIASVFLNRLKKNMKLQSDPTVIYGLVDFSGTLTKNDLQTPTSYNTYQIQGLPPGPICNPGRDSLQAVLTPADSTYLYFVSKNDGSHQFSKNLREHNRAVRKYQR